MEIAKFKAWVGKPKDTRGVSILTSPVAVGGAPGCGQGTANREQDYVNEMIRYECEDIGMTLNGDEFYGWVEVSRKQIQQTKKEAANSGDVQFEVYAISMGAGYRPPGGMTLLLAKVGYGFFAPSDGYNLAQDKAKEILDSLWQRDVQVIEGFKRVICK